MNGTDIAETTGPTPLAYPPGEVARLLHVATRTVDELIRSGELAAVRVGRHRRVTPGAIADYLAANPWKRTA